MVNPNSAAEGHGVSVVGLELEVLMRPPWTEQEHHEQVGPEVDRQADINDNKSLHNDVDKGDDKDHQQQIPEPEGEEDNKHLIDSKFQPIVLLLVDVPQLVPHVKQNEPTTAKVDSTCPIVQWDGDFPGMNLLVSLQRGD